jgi:hypothetical protein
MYRLLTVDSGCAAGLHQTLRLSFEGNVPFVHPMRVAFAAFLGLAMQIATASQPPEILQIYREVLKVGSESAYQVIEEDTAHIATTLGCPHPYLGIETLTGVTEVWWLNAYASPAEQKRVYDEYAKNTRLTSALHRNSERKASLTLSHSEVFANYRQDLSVPNPWSMGHGRFLVITVTKSHLHVEGTVFESTEGTRFIITSARTRKEADTAQVMAGPESKVFGVHPSWSFPAAGWIAADPTFWATK